jgi:hypothetical protein
VVKKGGKVLIGDNGWLERPPVSPQNKNKGSPKRSGILDSIKKMARDVVSDQLECHSRANS